MSVMTISFPDDLWEFIERQAEEEGHASAGNYIRSVLQEARKRKGMQILIARLDEALASGSAGPMTREDWDELERVVLKRASGDESIIQ